MNPFHPSRSDFRFVGSILVAVLLQAGHASMQKADKTAATITEASIRGHMEFLASDAMKGRGSGTEDEWRAATYIASQLRRWGVEPLGDDGSYVQRVDVGRPQVAAPPVLTLQKAKFTHGRQMIVQMLGRGASSGPLYTFKTGAPVPAGVFVLVPDGTPAPDAAALSGAGAVMTVETPQTRATWDVTGARVPAAQLARAGGAPQPLRIVLAKDAYDLVAAFNDGTIVSLDVEMKPAFTWNAIGQLKGSDPKTGSEVILLTAHLDHLGVRGNGPDTIFNGADDDASGSTAVLELAEALAAGKRPKRTVMFAWFGSEESGGGGARNFLAKPPAPLDHIVANLEFEMIANRDDKVAPHTLWLTGYERSNLGAELAKQGARLVADPHPEENFFRRSDNIQLACQGVIAHTVSSYDAKGATYHKANDDIAHVDFAHMTDSIQSMLKPVLWLSNSAFKPDWLPGQKPGSPSPCRG